MVSWRTDLEAGVKARKYDRHSDGIDLKRHARPSYHEGIRSVSLQERLSHNAFQQLYRLLPELDLHGDDRRDVIDAVIALVPDMAEPRTLTITDIRQAIGDCMQRKQNARTARKFGRIAG